MIRRPPRSTRVRSSAASDVYKRQGVKRVELLGAKGKLAWEQTAEGLSVTLPERAPSDFAVTLKISGLEN